MSPRTTTSSSSSNKLFTRTSFTFKIGMDALKLWTALPDGWATHCVMIPMNVKKMPSPFLLDKLQQYRKRKTVVF